MKVALGSFLAYGGALEPYLSQFDVEKLEMASVMGICAGLVGPKSENVEKVLVFKAFLNGKQRGDCDLVSLRGGVGGSPGRDIERGKPLFRRKMGRRIPTQTTQATRAWRILPNFYDSKCNGYM